MGTGGFDTAGLHRCGCSPLRRIFIGGKPPNPPWFGGSGACGKPPYQRAATKPGRAEPRRTPKARPKGYITDTLRS
ncbi:hypothetical protein GCM10009753_62240 [Streptantibioticus ferralitis]